MKRLLCGIAVAFFLMAGLSGCDASAPPVSSAADDTVPQPGLTSVIPPVENSDTVLSDTIQPGADEVESDTVQAVLVPGSGEDAPAPNDAVSAEVSKPANPETPVS